MSRSLQQNELKTYIFMAIVSDTHYQWKSERIIMHSNDFPTEKLFVSSAMPSPRREALYLVYRCETIRPRCDLYYSKTVIEYCTLLICMLCAARGDYSVHNRWNHTTGKSPNVGCGAKIGTAERLHVPWGRHAEFRRDFVSRRFIAIDGVITVDRTISACIILL